MPPAAAQSRCSPACICDASSHFRRGAPRAQVSEQARPQSCAAAHTSTVTNLRLRPPATQHRNSCDAARQCRPPPPARPAGGPKRKRGHHPLETRLSPLDTQAHNLSAIIVCSSAPSPTQTAALCSPPASPRTTSLSSGEEPNQGGAWRAFGADSGSPLLCSVSRSSTCLMVATTGSRRLRRGRLPAALVRGEPTLLGLWGTLCLVPPVRTRAATATRRLLPCPYYDGLSRAFTRRQRPRRRASGWG